MINRTQEDIMQNWPQKWTSPVVGIRCLTYNHEHFISQALDGFLMQKTNFPFEIVVHDDASTDKTASIIREYEMRFPQVIKPIYEMENQWAKRDGSLSRIMNSACKGKYFAYCEGDDYWIDPLKLQKQVDFLEKNISYSMCFHGAEIKQEGLVKTNLKCGCIENREYKPDELLKKWIVPTASILLRAECINYKIINPLRILNGDIFLVLKSSAMGKIYGMEDKMSVYRAHNTGITYDPRIRKARIMKYPEHFQCIQENFPKISPQYVKERLSESFFKRANIQNTLKDSIYDYAQSFKISRKIFFITLARSLKNFLECFLKKQIKKFFPSLYTKLKARYGKES